MRTYGADESVETIYLGTGGQGGWILRIVNKIRIFKQGYIN